MSQVVFASYDQAALDAQYNNRARVADFQTYLEKWAKQSAEVRANSKTARIDVAFGATPAEKLDIFPAAAPNAPVCMFIHGGYWFSLDKSDFSLIAASLVPNGVTCVVNNYGLCPDVTLDEIVRQNRAAVAWLWENASEIGIDRDRIHVSGHSAGGHLVTMLLATDWPEFCTGAPANLVKSGCAISGLYELEPLRLAYLNDVLRMDGEMAARNSPLQRRYPVSAPLLVVVGGAESEEFLRHSKAMTDHWKRLGYGVELAAPAGRNHFSIVDEFASPDGELVNKQLELIA